MVGKVSNKFWLRSYRLGPYKLAETLQPYPKVALHKILDDSAADYPTKVAIDYEGKEMRYRELKVMADSLANALTSLGANRGKSIVILLPNCPQFIISDFAILKTGAFTTPISPLHKASEIEYELNQCRAETIICLEDHLDLISLTKDKTNLQNIIVTSAKDFTREQAATPRKIAGTYQLRELIAKYEAEPPPPEPEIDPMEDLAYLAFTGGATGTPKGVMLTHYAKRCNLMQSLAWVYSPLIGSIKGKSSLIVPLPLYHVYAHWASHTAIYLGLRMILVADPRNTDTIVKLMQQHRPFLVCTVPTQLMRMAEKKIGRMPVMVMSGAAALPKEVADAVSAELKMPISEGYGLTETGPVTHMNLSAFSKITGFMPSVKLSIGVPVPDTEVKLIDPDTGKDVGFGGEGELYLRGPQTMKGYWPTPGKGLTKDGWVASGDIARSDEDGYFYIVDRVKDMANISGYKVYTTTIDDVLFTHPAVAMAAAIGIPDPERSGSERIKAFIKLKEGYEGKVSAEEIIEHCRDKVPPYAVPKLVEFKEDLPLTVSEKLFKKALRDEEITKMKRSGVLQ
ncbi:MAG: AMP-binding protein [Chloroflexi bacterium]|nr:AMP-binding protein [Chloroflexota bacterium]